MEAKKPKKILRFALPLGRKINGFHLLISYIYTQEQGLLVLLIYMQVKPTHVLGRFGNKRKKKID